jgi:hypothetical protein
MNEVLRGLGWPITGCFLRPDEQVDPVWEYTNAPGETLLTLSVH